MSSRSSKKTNSAPETPAGLSPGERIQVGKVVRAHGVGGEALVESFSDVAGRFAPRAVFLTAGKPGLPAQLTVTSSRPHRGAWLIRFAEAPDREAVDALRGVMLEVPADSVPAPPSDTWYHFQLIGCRCVDTVAGELGEVIDLVEDGGGSLLLVRTAQGQLLVPFVRAFLRGVDPVAKQIDLQLPEGLIEACASKS